MGEEQKEKQSEAIRHEIEAKAKEVERKRRELARQTEQEILHKKKSLEERQMKADEVNVLKQELSTFIREQAAESQLRKDEFFHFMEKLTKSAGAFDKLSKLNLDFEHPDPSQFNVEVLMKALKGDSDSLKSSPSKNAKKQKK